MKRVFISEKAQNNDYNQEAEVADPLQESTNDTQQLKNQKLSFPSLLKIGFIKLIKLNCTSISTFALHMVHCVDIDQQKRLYVFGDQQCYTIWQLAILYGLLPIVLLFPMSFGLSLNLLKSRHISTNKFLVASVLPYYAFYLYVQKKICGISDIEFRSEEARCVEEILQMEENLFKEHEKYLRWPVVQLYRNFIVVIMNIFILNPIYRTVCFIPLFLFFLVHDRWRKPYKHPYLNLLQCLSSGCLLVVSVCNIPSSYAVMGESMNIPHMAVVVTVLQYVEMVVYAAVPLSMVSWKLFALRMVRLGK